MLLFAVQDRVRCAHFFHNTPVVLSVIVCLTCSLRRVETESRFAYAVRITFVILRTARFLCVQYYAEIWVNATSGTTVRPSQSKTTGPTSSFFNMRSAQYVSKFSVGYPAPAAPFLCKAPKSQLSAGGGQTRYRTISCIERLDFSRSLGSSLPTRKTSGKVRAMKMMRSWLRTWTIVRNMSENTGLLTNNTSCLWSIPKYSPPEQRRSQISFHGWWNKIKYKIRHINYCSRPKMSWCEVQSCNRSLTKCWIPIWWGLEQRYSSAWK